MEDKKSTALFLQDPTDTLSYSLHEALLGACNNATEGGGMFSFVTQGGVQLLLEDDAFIEFLESSSFELIVGIDEVTNPKALSRLKALSTDRPNFKVSAFLHDEQRSLFHPKYCWFKTENGGRLVIGSGNLTFSGLRNNWEAYSVLELSSEDISSLEAKVNGWKELHAKELLPVDDEKVIEKSKKNVWKRKTVITEDVELVEQSIEEEHELEETVETLEDAILWNFRDSDKVLLAEIPKSGNRWRQANFDKKSFMEFFGAEPGNNNQRILLRSVDPEGVLGEVESRQSVSVKSQNYRFELGAAAGLEYPDSGPPIGIFFKIAKRVFIYCLIMPNDESYSDIKGVMDEKWSGRSDSMKRIVIKVDELRGSVQSLPFWNMAK